MRRLNQIESEVARSDLTRFWQHWSASGSKRLTGRQREKTCTQVESVERVSADLLSTPISDTGGCVAALLQLVKGALETDSPFR